MLAGEGERAGEEKRRYVIIPEIPERRGTSNPGRISGKVGERERERRDKGEDRETETQRDTHTYTHTETERQRETETVTESCLLFTHKSFGCIARPAFLAGTNLIFQWANIQ